MSASTLPVAATGVGRMRPGALAAAIPLLPRNAALALLHVYRAVVSPLYGDVCRYYPSCSAYAVSAVQQHGVVRGAGLAAWRLVRCHPWAAGGIEDAPPHPRFRYELTPHGFVVPNDGSSRS